MKKLIAIALMVVCVAGFSLGCKKDPKPAAGTGSEATSTETGTTETGTTETAE